MLESIAQQAALAGLTTRESDDYAITILELFAAAGDVLDLLQRADRQRAVPAHRTRAGFAAAADPPHRLPPAAGPRSADDAELRPRCGSRNAHPQGPQGDERPRPGREAADLRDDRSRSWPMPRSTRPRPSRRPFSSTASPWVRRRADRIAAGQSSRSATGSSSSGEDDRRKDRRPRCRPRADGDALAFAPAIQSRDAMPASARRRSSKAACASSGTMRPKPSMSTFRPQARPAGRSGWHRPSIASLAAPRLSLSARCALHGHCRRPAVADRNFGIGSREAARGDRRCARQDRRHGRGSPTKPPR